MYHYGKSTGDTSGGFYLLANLYLARIAADRRDVPTARRYFAVVEDKADHKSNEYREAREYLRQHKK